MSKLIANPWSRSVNPLSWKRRLLLAALCLALLAVLLLAWQTHQSRLPVTNSLDVNRTELVKPQLLDRDNNPITVTYANRWNHHQRLPLGQVPTLLRKAFVLSEDQRFFQHAGVDWRARMHALWQNLVALRKVRGASTISEQVVRLWQPRPRTVWSRWLEGVEATELEQRFSKAQILEFYLNQIEFVGQRRGVAQAARYYFDRDLDTLSSQEMIALAVLVRAPSRFDLHRDSQRRDANILQLAQRLYADGAISAQQLAQVDPEALQLKRSELATLAPHFARYAHQTSAADTASVQHLSSVTIESTLDSTLQKQLQTLLDERLHSLGNLQVNNGAALVVDHHSNEVLAWVVAGNQDDGTPAAHIDPIINPRQPGSTLKPFIYALAMEQGWNAATIIEDRPLAVKVGAGLHSYRNYSRVFYGPVTLRSALGNSLNIPAVKAVQKVTPEHFVRRAREFGIISLERHPTIYGDGLALGNGEVSLLELVTAYATLARQGQAQALSVVRGEQVLTATQVIEPAIASVIGDILADPQARELEFGRHGVLEFPVQTAVKTGTSSDYRDAWTLAYNDRYTVGVWFGNLDNTPMQGVTGATGPARVVRSVMALLNQHRETQSLSLDPQLLQKSICSQLKSAGASRADGNRAGSTNNNCPRRLEWFRTSDQLAEAAVVAKPRALELIMPTSGVTLAMDPRIPDQHEVINFALSKQDVKRAIWTLNGELLASSAESELQWRLTKGAHLLQVSVLDSDNQEHHFEREFLVK